MANNMLIQERRGKSFSKTLIINKFEEQLRTWALESDLTEFKSDSFPDMQFVSFSENYLTS
jgi:hypothetical protein